VKGGASLALSPDEPMLLATLKGPGKVWLQTGSRAALRALYGR
jgi:uncharacterized protein (AIM24 family)